jgi:NADPH oxidase
MGESWLKREILTPRRLAFNVIWYGIHLFIFGYGWQSQVSHSVASES